MSEELEIQVLVKSEKFNEKKEALKAFSEEIPEQSDLPTVPQDNLMFGFINMEYDVTGKDLNALTDAVQNKMIEQNKHIKKIIQEFNTIYETFQILDDEYIQSISKSLVAAKEANNKAIQGLHFKNCLDEINNKSITDENNLKLVVEGLEIKLEEKQKEIVFLKKGFYTLGIAVVLIVLFLLFKGM